MPATPAMRRAQGADSEHGQPRLKHKGKPIVFSQEALKSAADTNLPQQPAHCALRLRAVSHSPAPLSTGCWRGCQGVRDWLSQAAAGATSGGCSTAGAQREAAAAARQERGQPTLPLHSTRASTRQPAKPATAVSPRSAALSSLVADYLCVLCHMLSRTETRCSERRDRAEAEEEATRRSDKICQHTL